MELLKSIPDNMQPWLLEKGILIPRKEIPTECTKIKLRRFAKPEHFPWFVIHDLIHQQPYRVYSDAEMELAAYKEETKKRTGTNALMHRLRERGCSATSIPGFGASIGIERLILTPAEMRILAALFQNPEGIIDQELTKAFRVPKQITYDEPILAKHHVKVVVSRLNSVLSKYRTDVQILTPSSDPELAIMSGYRLG